MKFRRRSWAALALVFFLFFGGIAKGVHALQDKTIAELFPDPNMAQTIAAILASGNQNHVLTEEEIASVTDLNLASKDIEKVDGIEIFTNLRFLNLNSNKIKDIAALSTLKDLLYLNASYNRIASWPDMTAWTKLERLELNSNQLTEIPDAIGCLTALKWLNLNLNSVKRAALTDRIANLTELEYLNLSNVGAGQEPDEGINALPASIGKLTKLEEFHLYNNRLESLPAEILQLTKLKTVSLSYNHLTSLTKEQFDFLFPKDSLEMRVQLAQQTLSEKAAVESDYCPELLFPIYSQIQDFNKPKPLLQYALIDAADFEKYLNYEPVTMTEVEPEFDVSGKMLLAAKYLTAPGSYALVCAIDASSPAMRWSRYAAKFDVAYQYLVSFHSNGGSSIPVLPIFSGNTLSAPENPTRKGYSFVAWYTDEALTRLYDFSVPVEADITLYAKWKESALPTEPTAVPTTAPTTTATSAPTAVPTTAPTTTATSAPTAVPTTTTAPSEPTAVPTTAPTTTATSAPTAVPTTTTAPSEPTAPSSSVALSYPKLILEAVLQNSVGQNLSETRNFSVRLTGPSFPDGRLVTLISGQALNLSEKIAWGRYSLTQIGAEEYDVTLPDSLELSESKPEGKMQIIFRIREKQTSKPSSSSTDSDNTTSTKASLPRTGENRSLDEIVMTLFFLSALLLLAVKRRQKLD